MRASRISFGSGEVSVTPTACLLVVLLQLVSLGLFSASVGARAMRQTALGDGYVAPAKQAVTAARQPVSPASQPQQACLSALLAALFGRKAPAQLEASWLRVDESLGTMAIALEVPAASTHAVSYLNTPDRLVLDLGGVRLPKGSSNGSTPVQWQFAERIRYSQFDADTVRVVVDLRRPVLFETGRTSSPNGKDSITLVPAKGLSAVDIGADDGALGPALGAAAVVRLACSGTIPFVQASAPQADLVVLTTASAWTSIVNPLVQGWGPVGGVRCLSTSGGGLRLEMQLVGGMAVEVREGLRPGDVLLYLFPLLRSAVFAPLEGDMCLLLSTSPTLGLALGNVVLHDEVDAAGQRLLRVTIPGTLPADNVVISVGGTDGLVAAASVDAVGFSSEILLTLSLPVKPTLQASSSEPGAVVLRLTRPPLVGKLVILDPGHGGTDPGAMGPSGLAEKSVVLDVVQKLAGLLRQAGVTVMMTRETDVFVTLSDRAAYGVGLPVVADAFVSVHANSFTTSKPSGTETWYSKSAVAQSATLARLIQASVTRTMGLIDRGVKTDERLAVTRGRTIPSVLHELGFLSNRGEEALLADAGARSRFATALYEGIASFLKEGAAR